MSNVILVLDAVEPLAASENKLFFPTDRIAVYIALLCF
jgi:hypothetical protein